MGAAAEILGITLKLKNDQPFPGGPLSIQYHSAIPALNFSSLAEITQISVDGPVFAGAHLRGSSIAGVAQGKSVAHEVYANSLQKQGYGRRRRFYEDFFEQFDW